MPWMSNWRLDWRRRTSDNSSLMKTAVKLLVAAIVLACCQCSCLAPANAGSIEQSVIYQIVTDRFCDGDKTNNNPPQSRGLYDSAHFNWHAYWGGDLAGIGKKLPYLKALGVGAIWMSPVCDNVNRSVAFGRVEAGYHGYWPR